MIALLALGNLALAGYSTDVELARPSFSEAVLPGMDRPGGAGTGNVRVGTYVGYLRDPLVLYRGQTEVGAIVGERATATFGASVDVSDRFTLRATLPLAQQWASETPRLAADGFGAGDFAVGARAGLIRGPAYGVGASVDLFVPTGRQDAFLGEGSVRANLGVAAEGSLGPLRALGNVGIVGRPERPTGEDFTLGSELSLGGALRFEAWPGRASLGPGVLVRTGLTNAFGGEAETPVELLMGGNWAANRDWNVDVGVGRGAAAGYGTSQFRSWVGLVYQRRPEIPVPRGLRAVRPPRPPPEDVLQDFEVTPPPEPPPEPRWKPQELARVEEQQIIIRDPIQFELGTNQILAASLPTMRAIATLMAQRPEIAHLVIEGHASEEGDDAYNYELAMQRALEVFQALVNAGVHPWRLSCRSMGEVQPVMPGNSPEALAANRRVLFHVVRQLRSEEKTPPEMLAPVKVPWTGAPAPVLPLPERTPPPAAPEPAPSPGNFREEDEP